MKKLALFIGLPTLAMASHAIDVGAFYTDHKEKGYNYHFSGWTIKYEIGNSKGLKAVGKIFMSNDSDLLFVEARNEIVYFIPTGSLELFPFAGVYATHHNVFCKDNAVGTLQRSYIPLGMGLKGLHNAFSWSFRLAHMHPTSHSYFYDEGTDNFWGKKYHLPSNYFLEGSIGYQCNDKLRTSISGNWIQDYQQRLHTWLVEAFLSMTF